jgi:hypothetical protein
VVFQPNKELNGLSLGAVGRGTVIEYIEAYAAADDGFEFFGGTVNTRYLVSAFNDDDGFDIDQGYRGKNQYWFSIQERGKKDNGGEWNGEPNGAAVNASPIANYEIYNATWIGAGTNTTGNRGIFAREYAAPKLYNSILTEFGGNALRIDEKSGLHLTNGVLDMRDNLWWNFATNGVPVSLAENAVADVIFSDASRSNLNVNPQLRSISRTSDGALDPRPRDGSPALSGARPVPGGYTSAAYKGAFGSVNWATDWTAIGELRLISSAGAGIPVPTSSGPPCSPATLGVALNNGSIVITFLGTAGASYQVQSTADLSANPIVWNNEGGLLTGTGAINFTAPTSGAPKFYRVGCQ